MESAARGPWSPLTQRAGERGWWTPSNARISPNWAEAGGLLRVLLEGEIILSGARVLRGQVRKRVTLPFLVPDPIVSVACGPGRLRNTCWLHRYECLGFFFFFLLLFCVCRVTEPTPTLAHRPSGRRFSTVQKSGVKGQHAAPLSPSPLSPRAEKEMGLGRGGGGGLPTRFLHLHHLYSPPSKSLFCSCQPRVCRIFTFVIFFFLSLGPEKLKYYKPLVAE